MTVSIGVWLLLVNPFYFNRSAISCLLTKFPWFKNEVNYITSEKKSYVCDSSFRLKNVSHASNYFMTRSEQMLRSYCALVPIPRHNWQRAQRYAENDITFIIFTGAKFYHSRATAIRDTWLSRVTNYYFLGATPYSPLPVMVITGAGEDKLSNMKKIFYGLEIIYKEQQAKAQEERQKWFYLAGCDTYINVEHIIKRLDSFDYLQPLLIGGHVGKETCFNTVTKKSHPITFPSGGAGFFFSAKLLELMQPHLSNYVENIWPQNSELSDVALTCLAFQLGVHVTQVAGFWAFPPAQTLSMNGRTNFHSDMEPNTYHYVSPDEMYILDEFYVHQYVDRLVNDGNWLELTKFIRGFIVSHYELLASKRKICTLPPIPS
jgi:hypothetical protein